MRTLSTKLILQWAVVVLFLLSPWVTRSLQPQRYEGGRSRDVQQRALRNSGSIARMLGEFRTSMSDIMFLKTERYLHSGIGYASHAVVKDDSVSNAAKSLSAHQREVAEEKAGKKHSEEEHDEDHPETLIKSSDEDFRGIIGWMHRQVKPWQDPAKPHAHTDGTELLPWFKVMTLSDPHYIRAYALGGWWLKKESLEEALKFVNEGIRNNPQAFQIYYMRGNILFEKAKKLAGDDLYNPPAEVLKIFKEAQESFRTASDFAVEQRPQDLNLESVNASGWTFYKEGDALASARMLVLIEKYYGSEQSALQMARSYAAKIGNDPILLRIAEGAAPSK